MTLVNDGYLVEELKNLDNQTKRIYYHRDGTPTVPLPADPYSVSKYLSKGFTLQLPSSQETPLYISDKPKKSRGRLKRKRKKVKE